MIDWLCASVKLHWRTNESICADVIDRTLPARHGVDSSSSSSRIAPVLSAIQSQIPTDEQWRVNTQTNRQTDRHRDGDMRSLSSSVYCRHQSATYVVTPLLLTGRNYSVHSLQ